MKEISDIVQAYRKALQEQIRMALATVVMVEGSSYRRPGARMLVTEDGRLTGAISGGCLEGNALQKALVAIHHQQNKLVTYDTSNEDETEFGVQLGCNGIVHILFEPVDASNPNNPVALLEKLQQRREEAVIVTLFSFARRNNQRGTFLLAHGNTETRVHPTESFSTDLPDDIHLALQNKQTFLKKLVREGDMEQALIEYLPPPVHLVIVGAGNDAKPLADAAALLGWEVTVADGRATHALPRRFPKAKRVIQGTPEQIIAGIEIDAFTVFVLMTHNYKYDIAILEYLVGTNAAYIGALGPKIKLQRMFDDLAAAGLTLNETHKERIYGPIGLDIGAETSEEIAISITAEIKAVLGKRQGGSLKFLTTRMHEDTPVIS